MDPPLLASLLSSVDVVQNKLFLKKIFQEHSQSVKRSVGPDLGLNCL